MNKNMENILGQLWYKYGIHAEVTQTGFTDEVSCFGEPLSLAFPSLPSLDVSMKKRGINGTYAETFSFADITQLAHGRFEKKINEIAADVYNKACRTKLLIGVKGFDSDWKCRDFQYEIGKTYIQAELPRICRNGFHFCTEPMDCLTYYSPLDGSKYALVVAEDALVDTEYETFSISSKYATNKIKIVCDITESFLQSGLEAFYIMGRNRREDKATFYRLFCEAVCSQHPETQYYLMNLWRQACDSDDRLAFSAILGWDVIKKESYDDD